MRIKKFEWNFKDNKNIISAFKSIRETTTKCCTNVVKIYTRWNEKGKFWYLFIVLEEKNDEFDDDVEWVKEYVTSFIIWNILEKSGA